MGIVTADPISGDFRNPTKAIQVDMVAQKWCNTFAEILVFYLMTTVSKFHIQKYIINILSFTNKSCHW